MTKNTNKAGQKNQLSIQQINSVISLYSEGKIEQAIDEIKELNERFPNEPTLFNIIGACYKTLGDLHSAAKMFEIAVKINPKYAEAHFNLGVILKALGRIDQAIRSYQKAISILPNYPDAYNNIGNIFHELKRFSEAIDSYEWAIAFRHDFFQAYNNLGLCLSDFGNSELAVNNFRKAIEIEPNYIDAHFNLGISMKELGKRRESINSFESVLKIDSTHAKAHRNLSVIKKYTSEDPQISVIESLLNSDTLSESESIELNFAMAKVYEDLDDSKKFFKFLDKANKLNKNSLNYSIDEDKKRFFVLKKLFSTLPPTLRKNKKTLNDFQPIFILGMPRSGTSLIEQILASHNKVYGAGELKFLGEYSISCLNKIVSEGSKKITNKELISLRSKYLTSLNQINTNKKIITDKMPDNFKYVGFILSAFPDAKIIHVKRDPIATCWSNYKSFFATGGNGFASNQEDIAEFYNLYKDLMEFWNKLFPNKIFEISYEDLTINQEKETRKLLKYCDLNWDSNCLNFYENNRMVKTVSSLQVREKIYQGSSEIWKKYEENLKPLINGLNL